MAINPLEERNLSYDQAKEAGYILPGVFEPDKKTIQKESQWQKYFEELGSTIKSKIDVSQMYYDPVFGAGEAWVHDENMAKAYEDWKSLYKKQVELYGNEFKRNVGAEKAATKRALRAAGGLLSGTSAPSLSQGGGGLPALGTGTGPNLGDKSELGTRKAL